jgi:hypothetical protein
MKICRTIAGSPYRGFFFFLLSSFFVLVLVLVLVRSFRPFSSSSFFDPSPGPASLRSK